MTKISDALTYGLTIRESADDGSDFTNPIADYRRLFLGEDGQLHVKDSSGTVTAITSGAVATDAIWAAEGDIAYATGADAATVLTAGDDGDVLTLASGVPSWAPVSAAGAMTLITDTLLLSDTANFDFTTIAATYKHLMIEFQLRSDRAAAAGDAVKMTFNNDGGGNYDYSAAQHDGGAIYYSRAAAAASSFVSEVSAATAAAGAAGAGRIVIPNYAGTTWQKQYNVDAVTVLGTSAGEIRRWVTAGNWRSTSAITRITIAPVVGSNFVAGSRATLYGIS